MVRPYFGAKKMEVDPFLTAASSFGTVTSRSIFSWSKSSSKTAVRELLSAFPCCWTASKFPFSLHMLANVFGRCETVSPVVL